VKKRPSPLAIRLSKRLSVYVFSVGFGLLFWWLAENGTTPRNSRPGTPRTAQKKEEAGANQDHFSLGQPDTVRITDRVLKGESLSQALQRMGFSQVESATITDLLQKEINLKLIKPSDVIISERQAEENIVSQAKSQPWFESFELARNDPNGVPIRYRIERRSANVANDYVLRKIEPEVQSQVETLSGTINSTLYEGILYAGGEPALVNRFSDFFGWQIDFYREPQKGDTFKMVVETKYVDGRFIGYGRIKAAEYKSGSRVFRGFTYESADGQESGIYDENGLSSEKTFLGSPLEIARVTSRFGARFHPILKKQKVHNGVDYGARVGTPFWSIADGVVLEARYSPSAGNMIRIKHHNGYVTEYFHASKIAHGIRTGVKVRQKQIIGYVGTTGRSTGPHLHFGMMLGKAYVNPIKQNFPRGHQLNKNDIARFKKTIAPLVAELSKPVKTEITAAR